MRGSVEKKVAGKAGNITAQRERLRNEYYKSTTPRLGYAILHREIVSKKNIGDSIGDSEEATATGRCAS